jgi:hypothetical protein
VARIIRFQGEALLGRLLGGSFVVQNTR